MPFLLDLPAGDTAENYDAIHIWVALAATSHFVFDVDNLPSIEQLVDLGLAEYIAGCAARRDIHVRGVLMVRRLQYLLKHISTTAINT